MEKELSVKNESDYLYALWKSENNKLEADGTTIMQYFRVPIKQLKYWLKNIAYK